METLFTSNQYKVSNENLSNSFDGFITNVKNLKLWNISILPSGHGHYSIETLFIVNDKEKIIKTKTNNMQLIDAWKSGMNDLYDDGEDGFDNWNEVVESMLFAINAEDQICEFAED